MDDAVANREDAIKRVDAAAQQQWKNAAIMCLRWCAEQYDEFTADEVWEKLEASFPDVSTHEPAALGPRFRDAARRGWISKVPGRMRSHSKFGQRHRELQVWSSSL
jgi:hypothetical protein